MPSSYDKHYAAGGFGYDENIDKWRPWVTRYYVEEFGLAPGDRLLDAGCGDGFWGALLAENELVVSGFDRSEAGIDIARNRVPDGTWVVADLDVALPFDAEAFDVVFARGLSHLGMEELLTTRNRLALLRLMTVVRRGGILLTSTNSVRDGSRPRSWSNHPVSALVVLLEQVGEVVHMDLVGNYVQVAVAHRGAGWLRR